MISYNKLIKKNTKKLSKFIYIDYCFSFRFSL